MIPEDMVAVLDLPFDEAVEFFRNKGIEISPDGWRDVWKDANSRAFTVAGILQADVLVDIREAVDQAISEGKSLSEFKKELIPVLESKGWFAEKGEDVWEELPDGTKIKKINPWRLDLIYRANVQTAYSAGRYQEMLQVANRRPYWQYKAIVDARTRPAHAGMNNKVWDWRHPVWETWYPPNGFFCRCYVKSLSERQVRERGLQVETQGVSARPDEGWDYNPGKAGLDALEPDWSKYPDEVRDLLEQELGR